MYADATRAIKCKLTGAGAIPVTAHWVEIAATTARWQTADTVHTVTNGTTEVEIVGSPSSGNLRELISLNTVNTSGGSVTFVLFLDDGTNEREIIKTTLADGDQIVWADGLWYVLDANGNEKTTGGGLDINGLTATDPALDDEVPIYDVSASANRKVTVDEIGGLYAHVCEGRLTLTSGTPVTTSDVTGATTIYFTPYNGNRIALYDGTKWKIYSFSELSLSLSSISANKNYDVFIYDNAGTLTLELSAAWTNDTTRADALTTQDGVKVKSGATTRRYLGTIRGSATAGQVNDKRDERGLANWYNAVTRPLKKREHSGTSSWTSTNTAYHSWNNDSNNNVGVVVLEGRAVRLWFEGGFNTNGNPGSTPELSIGLDSTSTNSRTTGGRQDAVSSHTHQYLCTYCDVPSEGWHNFYMLEKTSATNSVLFFGESGDCGMIGEIEA
ncbi:MAG: hypothetical protein KatS3mg105_3308 [Gemmatales bacterium]|nr:MAG: hypothetical protein KatS3mg105_3308 [Gemmatales bacterium]